MSLATNPALLKDHNYKDDSNLKARRKLYEYEAQRIDIFGKILDVVISKRPTAVLDIGCGYGDVLIRLVKERGFEGRLTGIDLSSGMIAEAKTKSAEYSGIVQYLEGDALALPFEPSSFAVVMCNYALYHFSDMRQGVREAYRVLTNGGYYIGGTHQPHNMPKFGIFMREIARMYDLTLNTLAHERVNTANLDAMLEDFSTIEYKTYESPIRLTEPSPYLSYINSCRDLSFDRIPHDSEWRAAMQYVQREVEKEISENGFFEEVTAPALFIAYKGA